ncbi:hypothetical protein STFR1_30621 [Bacillus vallismortis]
MNLKEKVKIQEYAEKLRNYPKSTKQAICLKTRTSSNQENTC